MKNAVDEEVAIGAALGLLLSLMLENVGLGLVLGICIGSSGGILQRVKK
jgi:hypothetical protein